MTLYLSPLRISPFQVLRFGGWKRGRTDCKIPRQKPPNQCPQCIPGVIAWFREDAGYARLYVLTSLRLVHSNDIRIDFSDIPIR